MAKRDKRIERMQRNPKTVRPDELDAALRGAGFTVERQTGSHKIHNYGPYTLPVPQHKQYIKEIYVGQALDLLAKIAGEGDTKTADTVAEEDA